jgi:hypothetical protein
VSNTKADARYLILELLEATQDDNFVQRADTWLGLGMQDVLSRLRAWWAIRAATFQVEADGVIYLPPSYLEMITVLPIGGPKGIVAVSSDQAAPMFAGAGPPTGYLMEGTLLTLLPPQTIPYAARCTYFSSLNPLILDTDTNLYLDRALGAVIYAGAYHGAIYRGDNSSAQDYASAASSRIDVINQETPAARYGAGIVIQRDRS